MAPTGAGSAGPIPEAGALILAQRQVSPFNYVQANGGKAAVGATGGAGADYLLSPTATSAAGGAAGGDHGTSLTGGGDGANSLAGTNYEGAGGGGYAGGGSGGAASREVPLDSLNMGGGGGAGSNYTGGVGVAAGPTLNAGNGGQSTIDTVGQDGGAGYIQIICP